MYFLSKAFMLEILGFQYNQLGGKPIMVNAEYHKGSFCDYTPKFCQEGYCSGCEIYLKKSSPNRSMNEQVASMLQEVATDGSGFLFDK